MAELHFSLDLNILLRDRLGTMQIFYTPTLFLYFSGCHIIFSEKFSDGQRKIEIHVSKLSNKFHLLELFYFIFLFVSTWLLP
jgi:hypothetical protein